MPAVHPPRHQAVDPKTVRDLVLLLLKATRKLPEDDALRDMALDYLRRNKLEPSPQWDAEMEEGRS